MNHVFTHLSLEVHNEATMFKQSVWSEVLPSIQKHGAYTTKDKAIELFGLIDDDKAEAVRRVRNPRGETTLHYAVASYIQRNYPNVIITLGLRGEPDHVLTRMASKSKTHIKWHPD